MKDGSLSDYTDEYERSNYDTRENSAVKANKKASDSLQGSNKVSPQLSRVIVRRTSAHLHGDLQSPKVLGKSSKSNANNDNNEGPIKITQSENIDNNFEHDDATDRLLVSNVKALIEEIQNSYVIAPDLDGENEPDYTKVN